MDLVQVQQQLENQQSDLLQRISSIKNNFAQGRSANFSEQATEQENDEVLSQLLADAELELKQVSHGLKLIKEGRYGICEGCGESISVSRLEILPHTEYCIKCA